MKQGVYFRKQNSQCMKLASRYQKAKLDTLMNQLIGKNKHQNHL